MPSWDEIGRGQAHWRENHNGNYRKSSSKLINNIISSICHLSDVKLLFAPWASSHWVWIGPMWIHHNADRELVYHVRDSQEQTHISWSSLQCGLPILPGHVRTWQWVGLPFGGFAASCRGILIKWSAAGKENLRKSERFQKQQENHYKVRGCDPLTEAAGGA